MSNADIFQQVLAPRLQDPVTSLENASAVADGIAYDNVIISTGMAVQITSSAALVGGTLTIQTSLDGENWGNLFTPDIATTFTAAKTMIYNFDTANGAARYWRASIVEALAGGIVTVKIKGL